MTRAIGAALGAAGAAWIIGPGPPGPVTALALAALLVAGLAVFALRGSGAVLAAGIGAVAVALRLLAWPGPALAETPLPPGDGPWHAIVESLASTRDGQQPATVRLPDVGVRVAATLPRFPAVEPGMTLEVGGSLDAPPDGPYGDYLRRTGVAATLRARAMTIVSPSAGAGGFLERLRRESATALARSIPEPEAGLAAGILVGLRDRVDRALAADFTTAGASHVVAISGWNIAIVAASVAALGGRLARRRRAMLTAVAIAVYVVFVGLSPSVLRAAAMAGVVLIARESGRSGLAAIALAWAVLVLLLADPALVRDAGFQLSTVATGGLIAWATPLTAWFEARTQGRLPGWLAEGLGVSLAAQAATLPIVLASFGRLSVVAPVVNLAVVPLVTPAMAAGAVALVAGFVPLLPGAPAAVATLLGLPAWGLLAVIIGIVRAFAGLPFASVTLEPVAAAAVAAGIVLLLAVVGTSRGRRMLVRAPPERSPPARGLHPATRQAAATGRGWGIAAAAVLSTAIAGAGLVLVHRPDGATTLVVLDVGQGDAILIEGSRGGRLLVDGGPDADRLLVALDERLPPWDRRLDALVLTHPHEDHVAGLALLLERYRIGRVFEPGMQGPGPGYAAWLRNLRSRGTPVSLLAAGTHLSVDDARLRVLWPDPGTVPAEPADSGTGINNVSIVLLGEAAGQRFLLAGDIEEEIDPVLVERGLPDVDLLKVAHHGSGTATTGPFLAATSPSVAVVSAGARNRYGHPDPRTLDRLTASGARVLRTDADGTVEVRFDGGPLRPRTSGRRRAMARPPATRSASLLATNPFSCGIPAARPDTDPARAVVRTYDRYDPADDGPGASRSGEPPPEPRSATLVPPPRARSRRGGRLARGPDRRARRRDRPSARRDRRAPPRRGQAAAGRRPRPPPAARRRLR